MSVVNSVIFERKVSDGWQPVRVMDLHIGDIARMKETGGVVLRGEDGVEEYEVVSTGMSDPDTRKHVDISLYPVKG